VGEPVSSKVLARSGVRPQQAASRYRTGNIETKETKETKEKDETGRYPGMQIGMCAGEAAGEGRANWPIS